MSAADEIALVARAVWGDELGQCVVGRAHVYVFAVRGDRKLLHIEHPRAVEAAKAALAALMGAELCGSMVVHTGEVLPPLEPPPDVPQGEGG